MAPAEVKWISIAGGNGYTCALTAAGAAYCWGQGADGQLGDSARAQTEKPVAVTGGLTFVSLTVGFSHACGLTSGGSAYCWGTDFDGELGDGAGVPGNSYTFSYPRKVAGGFVFASLTAGRLFTCGVTAAGVAYCWGLNDYGQLGDGSTLVSMTPTRVTGGYTFASLTAGHHHACGLTTSLTAYCWGAEVWGELGDGQSLPICAPGTLGSAPCSTVPVAVAGGVTFTSLAAGMEHTCGAASSGVAYCWGHNFYGQLGDNSRDSAAGYMRTTPVAVAGGLAFASLTAGATHTCGVTATGVAYCWGSNGGGALGDSTTTMRLAPVSVAGGLAFTRVAAGFLHTCGVTSGGTAYCWGDSGTGELGNGSIGWSSFPVAVAKP